MRTQIDTDTIHYLGKAYDALKHAFESTKDGYTSDYIENAAEQIQTAMKLAVDEQYFVQAASTDEKEQLEETPPQEETQEPSEEDLNSGYVFKYKLVCYITNNNLTVVNKLVEDLAKKEDFIIRWVNNSLDIGVYIYGISSKKPLHLSDSLPTYITISKCS